MNETMKSQEMINREDKRVLVMRHRQFTEEIKPYVDAKVDVLRKAVPTITILPGGNIEYIYTPEQKETLRLLDETIETIKTRIFAQSKWLQV